MTVIAEGDRPDVGRTSRRFSWERVDPAVIRRLLVSVYEASGQFEEAAAVLDTGDAGLRRTAIQALNAEHIDVIVGLLPQG